MNREQILNLLEKNREKIKKFSVKKIGLFGSFAKNKQTNDSDIDIVVEFDVTNADNYFELQYFLEKLFKKMRVDLVIESGLKPEVKYIKKEAKYVPI